MEQWWEDSVYRFSGYCGSVELLYLKFYDDNGDLIYENEET
ncbi:MAG: hypothetical protein QXM75_02145 [Candidatus Diapherotrites archaeon]